MITVTFNSARVLPEFLASLSSQTERDWTLIAIDNASVDDSAERLIEWGEDRLQLVRNPLNVGFARATNQGLRMAMAQGIEWALILNNDTGFSPDAFAVLMQRAQVGDAAVYAPHIVYLRDPAMTWYGGGHFSAAGAFAPTWRAKGSRTGRRHEQSAGRNSRRDVANSFPRSCCGLRASSTKISSCTGKMSTSAGAGLSWVFGSASSQAR